MERRVGVTHEKIVKCTSPLNQVGRYVRPLLVVLDRSAKGLKRPIGQSLIRALRHIMKFTPHEYDLSLIYITFNEDDHLPRALLSLMLLPLSFSSAISGAIVPPGQYSSAEG